MTSSVVVAVVGPTATGKSDLGLALAELLRGEVINADAMQLYRGMDVGTAKVPVDERRGIAHHQLDVLDVSQEASVAHYQEHARADLAAISARGARPVVVGGSGLYVRAALDDIEFPGTDPEVRARWEARAAEQGPGRLHAELERLDPVAAASIGRANTRRIIRALEVIELTGRPYSATLPEHRYVVPAVQIGLDCDRDGLDPMIELIAIADGLERRYPELPLYFDLGELRGYHYHTGAVFAAFVPGIGQSIAQGGRYDDVGGNFGRARPATGFSTDLKTLVTLGDMQVDAQDAGVWAPDHHDLYLWQAVQRLRSEGVRVVQALPGQDVGAAHEAGCDRQLQLRDGRWQVAPLAS